MILNFFYTGCESLYWFLTRPLVAYPLGVLFTTFVALRAFYIQKRHERMAIQYEVLISGVAEIINTQSGSFLRAKTPTHEEIFNAVEKMTELQTRLPIYFSDEVKKLFADAQEKHDRGMKVKKTDVELKAFELSVIQDVHSALISQAKLDLRPNLIRFGGEFFSVFFCG